MQWWLYIAVFNTPASSQRDELVDHRRHGSFGLMILWFWPIWVQWVSHLIWLLLLIISNHALPTHFFWAPSHSAWFCCSSSSFDILCRWNGEVHGRKIRNLSLWVPGYERCTGVPCRGGGVSAGWAVHQVGQREKSLNQKGVALQTSLGFWIGIELGALVMHFLVQLLLASPGLVNGKYCTGNRHCLLLGLRYSQCEDVKRWFLPPSVPRPNDNSIHHGHILCYVHVHASMSLHFDGFCCRSNLLRGIYLESKCHAMPCHALQWCPAMGPTLMQVFNQLAIETKTEMAEKAAQVGRQSAAVPCSTARYPGGIRRHFYILVAYITYCITIGSFRQLCQYKPIHI